jgi:hypothetical protein
MRELKTVKPGCTRVVAVDEPEFGANHRYDVIPVKGSIPDGVTVDLMTNINFQKGPIKERGVNGCHNEDLIAIVIDRLQSFQKTDFSCRENALAITKLEEALHWLQHRTADRNKRGVEGRLEK